MRETTIAVKTPDGVMTTRTFCGDESRPSPVVLFFMDGLGVRDVLVEMAQRLASHGYYVALPDLFYRSGTYAPFDGARVFGDPAERDRIMALVREVTPARVTSDTAALLDRLGEEPAAEARSVGTVGYCMGGGPAISAAGSFPDRVKAAAAYHGGHLVTEAPDSPHLVASRARGRIYVGYAENDRSFSDADCAQLDASLSAAHVAHAMELYTAAHGFTMRDLPVYDQEAADRHWKTMLALFRDALV